MSGPFGAIGGFLTGGLSTLLAGGSIANFLTMGAFSGLMPGGSSQPQPFLQPSLPAATPAVPPPSRSDADIQASADRARRAYGIAGGRTNNALTGGIGVPSAQTYSAVTNLLGGVGQ